jgi:hypothetical protein
LSQRQIGAVLGVDQKTISRDLAETNVSKNGGSPSKVETNVSKPVGANAPAKNDPPEKEDSDSGANVPKPEPVEAVLGVFLASRSRNKCYPIVTQQQEILSQMTQRTGSLPMKRNWRLSQMTQSPQHSPRQASQRAFQMEQSPSPECRQQLISFIRIERRYRLVMLEANERTAKRAVSLRRSLRRDFSANASQIHLEFLGATQFCNKRGASGAGARRVGKISHYWRK